MAKYEKESTKALYKRGWFWIIIVGLGIIIGVTQNSKTVTTSTNSYQKDNSVEVTIVDFSTMSKEEAKTWMDTNKINCKIIEEYSNDITKGKFVSQSILANTVAHQGDKITIVYSLGKEPTTEEKNALKKAETYSNSLHMSKQGIYNQLTSSIEGFTKEAAQYAIDNIEADWNKNALEKAKTYQTSMNMSSKAIYNQLVSSVEGFTKSEAQYAIDNLDK
ncbi:MAG: Ltp family lipoprotein [Clostridium sp.]|jgi:beta-lactam-binding protein with PASTA domain|nr:Ltp family lipoprotein [Clostridium sp.]